MGSGSWPSTHTPNEPTCSESGSQNVPASHSLESQQKDLQAPSIHLVPCSQYCPVAASHDSPSFCVFGPGRHAMWIAPLVSLAISQVSPASRSHWVGARGSQNEP